MNFTKDAILILNRKHFYTKQHELVQYKLEAVINDRFSETVLSIVLNHTQQTNTAYLPNA